MKFFKFKFSSSFVDVSSTCELSTVSEHEARILQTDSEFGIQIYDCSDKKDRMFHEDHQAEMGVSFDPYKWDRKLPHLFKVFYILFNYFIN